MADGRVPTWVWAILVGAHALALGWALRTSSWDFPDSGRYLQAAQNLWHHGTLYARPWPGSAPYGQAVQEYTIRPLGYPLVVLGLGGLTIPPVVLLVVQNLVSLLNLGLVLRWWAHWARPALKSWSLAVLITLTFPAQLIYANAVMSEMMLQTAVVAMTGTGLFVMRTQKKAYFAGVAAALIAALLLKPVFYPLAFVLAGIGVWLAWRSKRTWLALIAAVPLLVVGLYMGWNNSRTGYFHFSSIAEINLLHYNAAGVVRQVAGPAAEERWVNAVLKQANRQASFAARQRLIQARATAVLWAHPAVYSRQHMQGMAAMFLDPGRFDISQFFGIGLTAKGGLLAQARSGGLLRALGRLPLGLMAVLAVIFLANVMRLVMATRGFYLLKNAEPVLRYGRWIPIGLLLYVALLTGPLGAARFLVPVWPLLLALSLVGLQGAKQLNVSVEEQQAAPVCENQG